MTAYPAPTARLEPLTETGFAVTADRSGVVWTLVHADGQEQHVLVPMQDLTAMIAALVETVGDSFAGTPPLYADRPPPPEQSGVILPRGVGLNSALNLPVLAYDFGGLRLNIAIDAEALRRVVGLVDRAYPPRQSRERVLNAGFSIRT